MEKGKIYLEPGKTYILKHTGQFCHTVGKKGFQEFSKGMNTEDRVEAVFVGVIDTDRGRRNIFFDTNHHSRLYFMFSAEVVDYIDGQQE